MTIRAWRRRTLEPPSVRDKNGLSRLRTVTMKIPGKPNGQWCTYPLT